MATSTFRKRAPGVCLVLVMTFHPPLAEPLQLLHPALTEKTIRAFNAYVQKTDFCGLMAKTSPRQDQPTKS